MRRLLSLLPVLLFAADPLIVTKQAGNDNVEISAKLILDPEASRQELGASLPASYLLVRVECSNKTGDPLRFSPADFVLISRKDGERVDALAPGQVAGGTALIVKRDTRAREFGELQNKPGFSGVSGVSKEQSVDADLLTALKAKQLPDMVVEQNSKNKAAGLVYFSMDTKKLKAKDLSLLYKGSGGRLTIDFK